MPVLRFPHRQFRLGRHLGVRQRQRKTLVYLAVLVVRLHIRPVCSRPLKPLQGGKNRFWHQRSACVIEMDDLLTARRIGANFFNIDHRIIPFLPGDERKPSL